MTITSRIKEKVVNARMIGLLVLVMGIYSISVKIQENFQSNQDQKSALREIQFKVSAYRL